MNIARILALSLALLAFPAIADDAVSLKERVRYYNVHGLTQEAIARSLRRDTPRDIDGFQGQTSFWFEWTFDQRAIDSRNGHAICSVVNAKVDIDIVITLPRHPTIARAPDELAALWEDFTAAMETHERNHAKDFAEIGSKIPAALNAITAPCANIDDVANAEGMHYVDLAQKAADDYDASTNHGETEGTVFPGL